MSAFAARLTAVPGLIPHHHCSLGPEEEAAAIRVLRSGRLAPGPGAARLERLLARLTGSADAVSLSSGSTALTLALRAFGLRAGDRVALPSYAGTGLLHAVRASGATPLICDIDPRSLAIDPEDLERRADRRVRAVLVGHPGGGVTDVRPFLGRGWKVIEDCSEALGAALGGHPAGAWGDAAIFCFAPARPVTCGGPGGAVASRQAGLVRSVRALATCEGQAVGPKRIEGLMGDLNAAIATAQIERLPELLASRASIAARYDSALRAARLGMTACGEDRHGIASRYLIRVPDARGIVAALRQRGIIAQRPVERPLHERLALRSRFPMTEAACDEIVSLPLYASLQDGVVARIAEETASLLG